MNAMLAVKPDNVPDELVIDFDFYALGDKEDDVQLAWAALHKGPDIVWTPHNGGHWIATRAADFDVMQIDHEHFSHEHFNLPKNDIDKTWIPLGLNPPDHGPYRKLITPAFFPKAIKVLEDIARDTAKALVADIAPRGRCEFIEEFAKVLPINIFLGMVDLPLEDRPFLLELAEVMVRSSSVSERVEANEKMQTYLGRYIDLRMQQPGEDVLSQIIQGEINGRPITRDEVMRIAVVLLFGGLDTIASQLGFFAHYLAQNPDARRELASDPSIHQVACEEMIRRFGLPNTARVLAMDYEYKEIQFRKGDMILIPKCLYGLDDRINADPTKVDFHRRPSTIKHAAFGAGPHNCPGAVLARRELMVFLSEWLPEIPDFELDPDDPVIMASGPVNGVLRLPLRWTV